MFAPSSRECVESGVLPYLHVKELPGLRALSKFTKNMVDTMPEVWFGAFHAAWPTIQLNPVSFETKEERPAVMTLSPLLDGVKILDDDGCAPRVFINSKAELTPLARSISSCKKIAAAHSSKGGTIAEVYLFCLKFHDITKPVSIDIPLSPELAKAMGVDGATITAHVMLKNGKFKWKFDGMPKTKGAVLDMSVKSPAVTLVQQIRISKTTTSVWQPIELAFSQDVDINAFLKGMAKAEEALLEGVPCTLCLRDPTHDFVDPARRRVIADVNSLCLDVVRKAPSHECPYCGQNAASGEASDDD